MKRRERERETKRRERDEEKRERESELKRGERNEQKREREIVEEKDVHRKIKGNCQSLSIVGSNVNLNMHIQSYRPKKIK